MASTAATPHNHVKNCELDATEKGKQVTTKDYEKGRRMDGIETLPYDEKCVIAGIACQTCGTTMSLHRGRFPICEDCLKVLREIIKERLEKEKAPATSFSSHK